MSTPGNCELSSGWICQNSRSGALWRRHISLGAVAWYRVFTCFAVQKFLIAHLGKPKTGRTEVRPHKIANSKTSRGFGDVLCALSSNLLTGVCVDYERGKRVSLNPPLQRDGLEIRTPRGSGLAGREAQVTAKSGGFPTGLGQVPPASTRLAGNRAAEVRGE